MNVTPLSSQSFGDLLYGNHIKDEILGKRSSRAINSKLQKITKQIKDEKLDYLKNVDIILNYDINKRFYCVISSKTQGIPNNPDNRCEINLLKDSVDNLKKWAKAWDLAFSPEEVNKLHKILNYVKRFISEDGSIYVNKLKNGLKQ